MTDVASALALTPGDPTQTIHFKVAMGFNQVLTYISGSLRAFPTRQELAEQARSDDPADRRKFLFEAGLCWTLLGCVAGLGMVVFGLPTGAVLGHVPGGIVLSAFAAVGFFCISGAVNVLWRWYWYLPKRGDVLARTGWVALGLPPMRSASPRNSSLIPQWGVGIVTFVAMVAGLS